MTALFYFLGFLSGIAASFLITYIIRTFREDTYCMVPSEKDFMGILKD